MRLWVADLLLCSWLIMWLHKSNRASIWQISYTMQLDKQLWKVWRCLPNQSTHIKASLTAKGWSTQRNNIVDKASQICFRTDSRQTILGKGAKWLLLWIIKKIIRLRCTKNFNVWAILSCCPENLYGDCPKKRTFSCTQVRPIAKVKMIFHFI